MKRNLIHLVFAAMLTVMAISAQAQNYVNAQPKGDHAVTFDVTAAGTKNSTELKWGADIAWKEEINLSRSKRFMEDALQVVRVSFQPTADVGTTIGSGTLSTDQIAALNQRISWLNAHTDKNKVLLMLNCDHPSDDNGTLCHANYKPTKEISSTNDNVVKRWAALIDLSKKYYENAGYRFVSIAPLNEPDYNHGYLSTNESYNQSLFKYLAQALKDRYGDAIRICGPNTLGFENAEAWTSKIGAANLDEVNTHELGWNYGNKHDNKTGMFANYWVGFYDKYKNSKKIINDEMHNTFEGMVGLEHGLSTGIWWGWADYVRGEFCKAAHGDKLAYEEDRTKYTAATVYRTPSGKIQAFGGTSERNAQTTAYRFVSTERDVFFDGQGPMREYTMTLPGGTAAQTGQSNAEGVVNVTYGEDIQPYINGTYALYNKSTNKVLELKNRNTETGTHLTTGTYSASKDYCQWNVFPVAPTIGGGFSYYSISSCAASLYLDCWDGKMDSGTPIGVYTANPGHWHKVQNWRVEYIGDGWFMIRNYASALSLAVAADGSICQKTKDAGDATQLWRILPVEDVTFAVRTIAAPTGVAATAQNASVKITWANAGNGTSYSVFKSETSKPTEYELIARDIKGTEFVDNKVVKGKKYFYVVKAVDATYNTSARSEEVSATPTGANGAVLQYGFEHVLTDASVNKNDGVALNAPTFEAGHASGQEAMKFDGTNFVRLSTDVASHDAITVAAWVNWTNSNNTGERIFEFAKDQNNYFYLQPKRTTQWLSGSKTDYAAGIKVAGTLVVEVSTSEKTSPGWHHVAVTLDGTNMKVYINGSEAATKACTLKPSDVGAFLNAIGSGQDSDAKNFKGLIDNFHVYNYAMSASEIKDLMDKADDTGNTEAGTGILTDYVKNPYMDEGLDDWTAVIEISTWYNNQIENNQGGDITGNFRALYGPEGFNGRVYQTITGIPNGVYELKAAVFRDQNWAHVADKDVVFLFANDEKTVVSTATPTFTKVLVQVTDGTLTIGLEATETIYCWMGIDNVSLKYYGDITLAEVQLALYKKVQQEAEMLLKDAKYSLITGAERSDLEAGRNFVPAENADAYVDATNKLKAYIDAFKAALPWYEFFSQEVRNGEALGIDVTSEKAMLYDPKVSVTQLQDKFPALYEKVEKAIDATYVHDRTSWVGNLKNWDNDMVDQSNGQHWDGKSTYREMHGDKWNLSAWTTYAEKRVTLPAGRYALRAAGRTSANVNLSMSVNYDNAMRFPNKGDNGRGVTTSGEKTFNASKTYVNDNNGRGWEYRTVLFNLDKEQEVVLRFDAIATSINQWCGLTGVELWRANDIVSMTITDAKYSTLMLPFAAKIPEGLEAFSCTVEGEHLRMTPETSIEANTPYVMRGETGTYKFEGLGEAEEDTYTSGCLTGVYTDIQAPVGSYVLQKQNGKVSFYIVGESKRPYVRANRAYVTAPTMGVKILSFMFDDGNGTTAIGCVEDNLMDMNVAVDVYTITGIKVSSGKSLAEVMHLLHKGSVYIVNGKMFIVR